MSQTFTCPGCHGAVEKAPVAFDSCPHCKKQFGVSVAIAIQKDAIRETFMGRHVCGCPDPDTHMWVRVDPPEPATPLGVPRETLEVAELIQEMQDELLFCEWFGALKEHLDGERMDRLCLALGLPEVGVSLVALDAVLRASAQKAMDGKILP